MKNTFGANVKKYRKMRRMTQVELSQALGFDAHSSLQRIETGVTQDVPVQTVCRIAEILNVSMKDLLGGQEQADQEEMYYFRKLMDAVNTAATRRQALEKEFGPYLEFADENTLNIIRRILNMPENA